MDKISVVSICYNLSSEIEKTIRSVLDQTYSNLEYIIVDGGSKDGTVDVIQRVLDDYPTADVNFKSERDKGIYDAMNKGLERASGDWVIFMNGGDWFHSKNTIAEFFTCIKQNTVIAHGDIIHENNGYRYRVSPAPLKAMSRCMAVKHQATFTRLNYHKKHLFDTTYKSAGDYDFFYKAHFVDNVTFQYIPLVVAHFNGIGGESTSNKWNSQIEHLKVMGKENSFVDLIKIGYDYFDIGLKLWIKSHLMPQKVAKRIEIARVRRQGMTEIEID